MITYGCLGILFLFVAIQCGLYVYRGRHAVTPEQIDRQLLDILNDGRDRNE